MNPGKVPSSPFFRASALILGLFATREACLVTGLITSFPGFDQAQVPLRGFREDVLPRDQLGSVHLPEQGGSDEGRDARPQTVVPYDGEIDGNQLGKSLLAERDDVLGAFDGGAALAAEPIGDGGTAHADQTADFGVIAPETLGEYFKQADRPGPEKSGIVNVHVVCILIVFVIL